MTIQLQADLNGVAVPLRHPWRACVGNCHAPIALRADWQAQLRQAKAELGFEYVRFHGLLGDDMGTLICQSEQFVYSFFNIDQVFDFLLSIGCARSSSCRSCHRPCSPAATRYSTTAPTSRRRATTPSGAN